SVKSALVALVPLLLVPAQAPLRDSATGPRVGGCPVFPSDNVWNAPVDRLPLHPHSSRYIRNIGPDKPLHPDFGREQTTGIPYNVVSGGPRKVKVQPLSDESDLDPAPIPPNPVLEGGEDRHLIVIDQDACRLYEFFDARILPTHEWQAGSAAYFDLRSNSLRPDGWASSDGVGLPIFPGLVRYEEIAAGELRHALRFSAPKTQRAYIWPARHFASRSSDPALPPMGLRVRLRADVRTVGFSRATQVILVALKKYGM